MPSFLSLSAVVFQLEDPPGSGSDHLVTTLPLDRETISNHVVTVIVEDGGYPARNDTAIMNLTLSDINDNEPIWTAGHGTEFNIDEVQHSFVICVHMPCFVHCYVLWPSRWPCGSLGRAHSSGE